MLPTRTRYSYLASLQTTNMSLVGEAYGGYLDEDEAMAYLTEALGRYGAGAEGSLTGRIDGIVICARKFIVEPDGTIKEVAEP